MAKIVGLERKFVRVYTTMEAKILCMLMVERSVNSQQRTLNKTIFSVFRKHFKRFFS